MLFVWNNYQINFKVWGKGPIPLLAFHGFGQNLDVFNHFQQALSPYFTVYSFDHFHHGNSKLPKTMSSLDPIPADDYTQMFQDFVKENQLHNYWLMGYSLGGKSVMHLCKHLQEAPKGIILLAADGITESGWYGFVSRTQLGEILYKTTMFRGQFFDMILKTLYKLKFVNNSLHKFVQVNVGSKKKRAQVLFAWKSLANIKKADVETYKRIKLEKIKCLFIVGKYDQVIDPKMGKIFYSNTGIKPIVWEAGHDLIKSKFQDKLNELLRSEITI